MKLQLIHTFEEITSVENLLLAWKEFVKGKRGKPDVNIFSLNLMDNILSLHLDLVNQEYVHGAYHSFNISDPKPRKIHKASVRDRLLHHAVYRVLYPSFDNVFTSDSFSCRKGKGTHEALKRFKSFQNKVSKNRTRTCWVLKCDIRKFFASIDHNILMDVFRSYIPDKDCLWLLSQVVRSFSSTAPGIGLPLGSLTSQLFVNIYMNEFDQFVKHRLKVKQYIRYADDFVALSADRLYLESILGAMTVFLKERLKLDMHPDKVYIATVASGLDFLGWIHFSDHRILRSATRKRMDKRIATQASPETNASYLGLLQHGNSWKVTRPILEDAFFSGFPRSPKRAGE